MRLSPLIAPLLALATAAAAQDAMTADEFEAFAEGSTLTFGIDGAPYGIEEYRPGRRVRWSVFDGTCLEGIWYPEGDQICFRYDGLDEDRCWRFRPSPEGLAGTFTSRLDDATRYEVRRTTEPLECPGPKVGV